MATQGFPSSQNTLNPAPQIPPPTKESGQRSIDTGDIFFSRFTTPWARPDVVSADMWRKFVMLQPIAVDCKESLQSSVIGFDWSVTARDSEKRDELKSVIKYYTKLIDKGGDYFDFGYEGLIERVLSDFLDIPFGAGAEIGRKKDNPNGRVVWVKPMDGATLYPTLNRKVPVIQYYNGHSAQFPSHAMSRVYMTPSTNILREGWGMAPPEKVYFALEMLRRGDSYYSNLLLDTPPAGLLDLGDMEKDSAYDWATAFRAFQAGDPSSFAIPILYEHTTDVKFIPFGKVPNDIMYDRITLKYAAIVTAAYGLSLGDIGLQTTSASGETLAGSIRQERRSKRTGIARAKKAIKRFMENFLPDTLQFNIIDPDDEVNMSMGKARLATVTAFKPMYEMGIFSREEMRLQMLQDGLMNKDFPEGIPEDVEPVDTGNTPERPGSLGSSESAASGGQGNVRLSAISVKKSKDFERYVKGFVGDIVKSTGKSIITAKKELSEDDIYLVRSLVDTSLFGDVDSLELIEAIKSVWKGKKWMKLSFDKSLPEELEKFASRNMSDDKKEKLHNVDWVSVANEFKSDIDEGTKEFIGKSTVYLLKDILLAEN
ncbi:hypothetical protein HN803_04995, partial [candidate division WWE3 bacterium]|nr:hypothetical protein [candidate division WWE3 bacterium]